jgi:hypothetical protein
MGTKGLVLSVAAPLQSKTQNDGSWKQKKAGGHRGGDGPSREKEG